MSNVSVGINLTLLGQAQVVSGMRGVTTEFEQAGNRATASFGKTRAGLESISTQLQSLQNYAKAWIGASQLIGLTSSIVKTADEYVGLQARLKLATSSQLEFNTANTALFAIAQQNGVPLKESLGLYSKLAPALRELGATQAQTLTMTDLVGKSLRLSGAGAAESASTMLQFSQALGSGVLRGDEFNSLMENSPRLMKAVADGLGKPIGELRKMAEEGKLTADVVVNSLLSQKQKLESEYTSLPLTVSAAWTKMGNAVTQEIGRIDKESGGATGHLAQALGNLADNLKVLENAMISAAKVGAGAFVASLVATRTAAIEAAGIAGIGMLRNALAGLMLLYSTGGIAGVASGILGIGTASAAATPAAMTLAGVIGAIVWPAAIAYGIYEFGKYAFETFKSVRLYVTEFVAVAQRAAVALAHPIDAFQNNTAHQARIKEINDTVAAVWAMENAPDVSSPKTLGKDAPLKPGGKTDKKEDPEQKRYEALIKASNDRIAAFAAESTASEKLTESEKQLAIFEAQIRDGKTGLIGKHIESAHVKLQEVVASEQVAIAHAVELKAREEMLKGLESETSSIKKQIESTKNEIAELGKTKAEIALLQSQRGDHTTAILEERLAKLDSAGACTIESEALREQIKARKELKDLLEKKSVEAARVDAAKKIEEEFKKSSERISQSLTDALMRGFESGKTFSQNLRDTTYNLFKTMILEPQIKASVQPLADALNRIISDFASGIAKSLNQSGTGGGMAGGIGSFVSSLFNANGNAFGLSGVQAFANGGAFTNNIVSSPTPFQFANGGSFGLGVMGEAGPEAVMPLTRTSGGQLGVRMAGAQGAAQDNITITVMVNTQSGAVDSKAQGGNANVGGLQQLGNQIGSMVRDILVQEKRPGGLLA